MPLHPLDRDIASDLSQLVLKLRRRRGELGAQTLDSSNQTLYALPSQLAGREAFIADRDTVLERDDLTPTWAWHGRKRNR